MEVDAEKDPLQAQDRQSRHRKEEVRTKRSVIAAIPATVSEVASETVLPPPRLLDRLHAEIRLRHYSIRTEEAYVDWSRRFTLFHAKRHPQDMGVEEVTAFLTHLAAERNVSASTQNQAKAALLFLYGQILKVDLPWPSHCRRPRLRQEPARRLVPKEPSSS